MALTIEPHASFYEATIENAELEQALHERQKRKARLALARVSFREVEPSTPQRLPRKPLGLA